MMGFYMSKISCRTLHWSDGILVLQLLNTHLDIYKDFLKLNIAHTTQITAASMYISHHHMLFYNTLHFMTPLLRFQVVI